MKKVKEFLGESPNKTNIYYSHMIINAIKSTNTKFIIIEMNNGRKFMVGEIDKDFSKKTFVTLNDVFVDGIEYKEIVIINTNFISSILYDA